MKTKDYLQKAVDFIEANLHNSISVEDVAREVGFSKFYLNRLFSVYSGLSIMEYVRKRKLNASMEELQTRARILDIAIKYSYSSDRSFSRAFVKEFGNSPSYYRYNPIVTSKPLIIHDLELFREGDDMIEAFKNFKTDELFYLKKEGVRKFMNYLSDIKYETLKNMTVLSGTVIGSEPEEEVIGIMKQLGEVIGITSVREFGFDSPVNEDDSSKGYRGYEYWLVISPDQMSKVTDYAKNINKTYSKDLTFNFKSLTITQMTIPSYRYVTIRITDPFANPMERIPLGWKSLVKWLESNDYSLENSEQENCLNCLEEVVEEDGLTYMDLYIPVDKG